MRSKPFRRYRIVPLSGLLVEHAVLVQLPVWSRRPPAHFWTAVFFGIEPSILTSGAGRPSLPLDGYNVAPGLNRHWNTSPVMPEDATPGLGDSHPPVAQNPPLSYLLARVKATGPPSSGCLPVICGRCSDLREGGCPRGLGA